VVLSARRAGAEQLEEVRLASEREFEACFAAALHESDPRRVRVIALSAAEWRLHLAATCSSGRLLVLSHQPAARLGPGAAAARAARRVCGRQGQPTRAPSCAGAPSARRCEGGAPSPARGHRAQWHSPAGSATAWTGSSRGAAFQQRGGLAHRARAPRSCPASVRRAAGSCARSCPARVRRAAGSCARSCAAHGEGGGVPVCGGGLDSGRWSGF